MTILTQPQDATIVEGGDATFVCAGLENGMAVQFIWDFTPVGGHRRAVSTGSNLTGISMVTVNGDLTQLTLRGVQREVEGAMVLCSAIGSTGNVDSNPATVTVYCKWNLARMKLLWEGLILKRIRSRIVIRKGESFD